jgi:hypothetical protein
MLEQTRDLSVECEPVDPERVEVRDESGSFTDVLGPVGGDDLERRSQFEVLRLVRPGGAQLVTTGAAAVLIAHNIYYVK